MQAKDTTPRVQGKPNEDPGEAPPPGKTVVKKTFKKSSANAFNPTAAPLVRAETEETKVPPPVMNPYETGEVDPRMLPPNMYDARKVPPTQFQPPPGYMPPMDFYGRGGVGMDQRVMMRPEEAAIRMEGSVDIRRIYSENDKETYDKVVDAIFNLRFPEHREQALMELGRKRESFKTLAPLMWHSFGTIAILLQELVNAYPQLSPPTLNASMSSRVCSVLGLFQCLALNQDTRQNFLTAHLPLFLYPFLYTQSKLKPFENLRVSSLGVIGALVKGDDQNVINFLLQTEIIPLCLRIMKKGQELSKTVATFIVQKILNDKQGLNYICMTVERLYAVSLVLKNMTEELFKTGRDDQKLLRHIIRCYVRLLDFQKNEVYDHVAKEMPEVLKDPTQRLLQDESVQKLHQELLTKLEEHVGGPQNM